MLERKKKLGWDSSVGTVAGLHAVRSGFDSWEGQEIFFFSKTSLSVLGPTQLSVQSTPRVIFLGSNAAKA